MRWLVPFRQMYLYVLFRGSRLHCLGDRGLPATTLPRLSCESGTSSILSHRQIFEVLQSY